MTKEEQIEMLENIIEKIKERKGLISVVSYEPKIKEYDLLGREAKQEIIGSTICIEVEIIK